MHSFVLQDWTTIRGQSSTTNVTQGESGWLDLAPYQDVSIWLDVREVSGTTPQIFFETSPIKEDGLFQTMVSTNLTTSPSNPYRVPITTANTPVARYVRWRIQAAASGAWDATFRVLLSADGLGM